MTVRSLVTTLMRGATKGQGITKEAVVDLIHQASSKQKGVRKGWQVKAATWVKKVHVDRGDVKVGVYSRGRFSVLPHLRPRYFVPADLDKFELKPYVEVESPSKPKADATATVAAASSASTGSAPR